MGPPGVLGGLSYVDVPLGECPSIGQRYADSMTDKEELVKAVQEIIEVELPF